MKKHIVLFALLLAVQSHAQWGGWGRYFIKSGNIISQSNTLDTLQVNQFRVGNSATSGHVLTANSRGVATFQAGGVSIPQARANTGWTSNGTTATDTLASIYRLDKSNIRFLVADADGDTVGIFPNGNSSVNGQQPFFYKQGSTVRVSIDSNGVVGSRNASVGGVSFAVSDPADGDVLTRLTTIASTTGNGNIGQILLQGNVSTWTISNAGENIIGHGAQCILLGTTTEPSGLGNGGIAIQPTARASNPIELLDTDASLVHQFNLNSSGDGQYILKDNAANIRLNLVGGNGDVGNTVLRSQSILFTEAGGTDYAFLSGATTNNFDFDPGNDGVDFEVADGAVTITGTTAASGNITVTAQYASTPTTLTLGAGVTTFAVTRNAHTVDGDAGGNTVATITGGVSGMMLTLKFVDASVTFTNDDTGTANTIDLSAAFTSSARDMMQLYFDGTSWLEVSRSVN